MGELCVLVVREGTGKLKFADKVCMLPECTVVIDCPVGCVSCWCCRLARLTDCLFRGSCDIYYSEYMAPVGLQYFTAGLGAVLLYCCANGTPNK